jgi:ATP-dependent RNA helicase DeaD
MTSFEEIGLREELLRTLEEEDIAKPTAVQSAVIPALRRGGNVVARASAGSGKTLAYTLGVLDRLQVAGEEEEAGPRVLVLTPTVEDAERVAQTVTPYAQAVGMDLTVLSASWGIPATEARFVVSAAGDVLDAVRASTVKLDRLEAVVIDGAVAIDRLGHWNGVDDLLDLVPRDAQRVVISSTPSTAVEDLVERRVKRALRYPAEPALQDLRESRPTSGAIGYVVAPEPTKVGLLAAQLGRAEGHGNPPILFCRNDERAAELAERLTLRGFAVGQADEGEADVALAAGGATRAELIENLEGEPGQSISYDVPPDSETLLERHQGDADAIILVEPRELAHLREIARRANLEARAASLPSEPPASAAERRAFQDEVRAAIRDEDLSAQFLILDPLFEEFSPFEVAGALSALLRTRRAATAPQSVEEVHKRHPAESGVSAGPPPVTWARLFVSVGSRDDVGPGDLVGALAGEANIPGSRIGKIEIRDSFSIVEVEAAIADQVIRAVNGTTLKGRSVRVDYDRGGPTRRPPTRGGAPRRTTRRPPG